MGDSNTTYERLRPLERERTSTFGRDRGMDFAWRNAGENLLTMISADCQPKG
jgi:hypothetical protein